MLGLDVKPRLPFPYCLSVCCHGSGSGNASAVARSSPRWAAIEGATAARSTEKRSDHGRHSQHSHCTAASRIRNRRM